MIGRISRLALPTALAILILAPAVGVLLTGRDLQAANYFATPDFAVGGAVWVLRLATLTVLALSALVIVERTLLRKAVPIGRAELFLLLAFLAFFASNVVLPGLLGRVPGIERTNFYVVGVFIAVFLARSDGVDGLLDAVKVSILAVLLASIALVAVIPDAVVRTDPSELRLPLVPFRLWGLSSSPNSLGPNALTLILILLVRPFRHRALTGLAMAAATVALLLSQSQTSWIAATLIVPPLLLYRRHLALHGSLRLRMPPGIVLAGAGLGLGLAILTAASLFGTGSGTVKLTPGLTANDDFFTGRGTIWRVAWDLFEQNPWFGYGLAAWNDAFREATNMPFAFHAHNQLMQSLSEAGLVGALGLIVYAVVLFGGSLRVAATTGGLAPALGAMAALGCISEVPLDLETLLLGETMRHAMLFGVIAAAYHAHRAGPTSAESVGHRTREAVSGRARRGRRGSVRIA